MGQDNIRKCVIMQPTYLPWLGFFELLSQADVFVIYDDVQFIRSSYHQRNRIKTANGVTELTIPIQHTGQDTLINQAHISFDHGNKLQDHWKTITNAYKKINNIFLKEHKKSTSSS